MHFTEERARDLLFLNPPNPGKIQELIDSSWFVSRPYAGVLMTTRNGIRDHRFKMHPLYEEYAIEEMRRSEALYLRARVRRRFRAIVVMKLFVHAWGRMFREQYYGPGGGGYMAAKKRFEETLCLM